MPSAKASIYYIGANLISRALGFALTPVFTRMLSPEEYGIYSVYTSFLGIFTVITTLEISGSVLYRAISNVGEEERCAIISSTAGAQIILSLIFSIIYIIFRNFFYAIVPLSLTLSLILIAQVCINSIESIYFINKRYLYDYKRVSYINIAKGVLSSLLSFALIKTSLLGEGRIYAPFIISFIFILPIGISIFRKGKVFLKKDTLRYILFSAIPSLPYSLSTSLIASVDRITVSKIYGEAVVGKYSVAHSLGLALSLITGGLTLALMPWMTRKLRENDNVKIKRALSLSVRFVSLATHFFLCVAPEIFALFAPTGYRNAISSVYTVAISVTPAFIAGLYSNLILLVDKPYTLIKSSLPTAVFAVISSYIFALKFGPYGASVSHLCSCILLFILNGVLVSRRIKSIRIKPLDFAYSFFLLFFFGFLLFFLREFIISRILIFLAISLLALGEIYKIKKAV